MGKRKALPVPDTQTLFYTRVQFLQEGNCTGLLRIIEERDDVKGEAE
jgi:hypothetical protein